MWFGKIIAGLIGFAVAGFFGLIAGVVIGHYFDRGLKGLAGPVSSGARRAIEEVFFRTVFLSMGRLAKSDGRISEAEIAHTEQLMASMGLHSSHRQEAIALFKEGAKPDFSLDEQLQLFKSRCGRYPNLVRQLLNYLLSLALADGIFSAGEEAVLREISTRLGIPPAMFEHLIRMIRAQSHFKDYGAAGSATGTSPSELIIAYEALGVNESATDSEVKRAYRKQMSENHPDKLMGQGVPEDMIKLATERSQEIQTAYDLICRHRDNR